MTPAEIACTSSDMSESAEERARLALQAPVSEPPCDCINDSLGAWLVDHCYCHNQGDAIWAAEWCVQENNVALVAQAIRDAESAAYERAAAWLEKEHRDNAFTGPARRYAKAIRAMKDDDYGKEYNQV